MTPDALTEKLTDEVLARAADEIMEWHRGYWMSARTPERFAAMRAVLLAALTAEPEPTWRSIATLPAPVNSAANQRVHVYMPDVIGHKVQVMTIGNIPRMGTRVTHWMPLPAPPAEQP